MALCASARFQERADAVTRASASVSMPRDSAWASTQAFLSLSVSAITPISVSIRFTSAQYSSSERHDSSIRMSYTPDRSGAHFDESSVMQSITLGGAAVRSEKPGAAASGDSGPS